MPNTLQVGVAARFPARNSILQAWRTMPATLASGKIPRQTVSFTISGLWWPDRRSRPPDGQRDSAEPG